VYVGVSDCDEDLNGRFPAMFVVGGWKEIGAETLASDSYSVDTTPSNPPAYIKFIIGPQIRQYQLVATTHP
jgi:hypothetical protein